MAQSLIQIKRSLGNLAPSKLRPGELAYSASETDSNGLTKGVFYIGGAQAGADGYAAAIYTIGGTKYTTLLDVTPGSVTPGKAIVVDTNGQIDNIDVSGTVQASTIVGQTNETGETQLVIGSADAVGQKVVIHDPYVVDDDGNTVKLDSFIDTLVKDGVITLVAGDGIADITNNNGTYNIALKPTGVTAGTYGSTTKIPSVTLNQYGQVTAVEEKTISTTLNVATEDGSVSGSVDLLNGALKAKDGVTVEAGVDGVAFVKADETVLRTAGAQTAAGVKTFSDMPIVTADQGDVKTGEMNEVVKLGTLNAQTVYTDESENGATITVGGVEKGTKYENTNVLDVLHAILHPYVATSGINLSLVTGGGTFEVGDTKTVSTGTVTWKTGSTKATKVEVLSSGVVKGSATVNGGSSTAIDIDPDVVLGSSAGTTAFNAKVYDDGGAKSYTGGNVSYTFVYPFFYGAVASNTVSGDTIVGLTKKVESKGTKAWAFTANYQRCCFAYPASYGNISKIFDANNFDVTSTFVKSTVSVTLPVSGDTVTYNVYVNEASTITNFNFKFQF